MEEHHQMRILSAVLLALLTFSLVSAGSQPFYMVGEDGGCSLSNLTAVEAPAINVLPYDKTFPTKATSCSFYWNSAPDSFISVRINLEQNTSYAASCGEVFKTKTEQNGLITQYCGINGSSEIFVAKSSEFYLTYDIAAGTQYSGWKFSLLITPYIMNDDAELCRSPPYTFRCLAGECIHHSLQCDGARNCWLVFDERDQNCPLVNTTTSTTTTTVSPATTKSVTTTETVTTTESVTTTKSATTTESPATTKSATTTESPATTKSATTTESPATTKSATTTESPPKTTITINSANSPVKMLFAKTEVLTMWEEFGTIVGITAGPIVVSMCIIACIVCGCRRRNAGRKKPSVRDAQTSTEDIQNVYQCSSRGNNV